MALDAMLRHYCGLTCSVLLTSRTPSTDLAKLTALSTSSGDFTRPASVTTPAVVSTEICNADRSGSAANFTLMAAVVRASAVASTTFSPAFSKAAFTSGAFSTALSRAATASVLMSSRTRGDEINQMATPPITRPKRNEVNGFIRVSLVCQWCLKSIESASAPHEQADLPVHDTATSSWHWNLQPSRWIESRAEERVCGQDSCTLHETDRTASPESGRPMVPEASPRQGTWTITFCRAGPLTTSRSGEHFSHFHKSDRGCVA